MRWTDFVQWVLSHIGELPGIIELAKRLAEADDIPSRWEAFKNLGDVVVPLIGDFPASNLSDPEEVESLHDSVTALGFSLDDLYMLYRTLKHLIPLLLELLKDDE